MNLSTLRLAAAVPRVTMFMLLVAPGTIAAGADAALAHAVTLLIEMTRWRATPAFARQAYAANVPMMTAGFALMGFQLVGLVVA